MAQFICINKFLKLNTMKNKYFFYMIAIIALFGSNLLFSQQLNNINMDIKMSTIKIVQELNTPTKIWVNGGWKIKSDGARVWIKGHWEFEEKTFQKKSELFRERLNQNSKV